MNLSRRQRQEKLSEMGQNKMYEKLLTIVKDYVDIDAATVSNESNFMMDLGIDSFTLSEIACEIEDEFDIEIPDNKMHELKTVGDVVSFIEAVAD